MITIKMLKQRIAELEAKNKLQEQQLKQYEHAYALYLRLCIIRIAIVNGLDLYQYLLELFNRTPYCKTVEDYRSLLPWNIEQTNFSKTKKWLSDLHVKQH